MILLLFSILFLFTSCETQELAPESVNKFSSNSEYGGGYGDEIEFEGITTVTNVDDSSARIFWSSHSDASKYYIYDVTETAVNLIQVVDAPASDVNLYSLESGREYNFRVNAMGANNVIEQNQKLFSVTTHAFALPPTLILKTAPIASQDVVKSVSLDVYGVNVGDIVSLHSNSTCSSLVESKVATAESISFVVDDLNIGSYQFYAKRKNINGIESNCSSFNASYTVLECPDNYIKVPGNTELNQEDFCVMKYEARAWKDIDGDAVIDSSEVDSQGCSDASCSVKNYLTSDHYPVSYADNLPWRGIDVLNAKSECKSLGEGYDLLSNNEFITIAWNIEQNSANWSSGILGNGCLNRGNVGVDDACSYSGTEIKTGTIRDNKSKHVLSNGEEIFDLSGNVKEYVDFGKEDNYSFAPTTCMASWIGLSKDFCYGSIDEKTYLPYNFDSYSFSVNYQKISKIYSAGGVNNHFLIAISDDEIALSKNRGESFSVLNDPNLSILSTAQRTSLEFYFDEATETIYLAHSAVGVFVSSNYGSSFTLKTTANGLINYDISSPYKGEDGTLYFLTSIGIQYTVDSGISFSSLTTTQGLASNDIRSMVQYKDNFGNVWSFIATGNGLSFSSSGISAFTSIPILDTDASTPITDIIDVDIIESRLWVSTNLGIAISDINTTTVFDYDGVDLCFKNNIINGSSNSCDQIEVLKISGKYVFTPDSSCHQSEIATGIDSNCRAYEKSESSFLGTSNINFIKLQNSKLWIGTDIGLYYSFNLGASFNLLTTSYGLSNNNILDVNEITYKGNTLLSVQTSAATDYIINAKYSKKLSPTIFESFSTLYSQTFNFRLDTFFATDIGVIRSSDLGSSYELLSSTHSLWGDNSLGLGYLYGGSGGVITRGGDFTSGIYGGLFQMSYETTQNLFTNTTGFRCVYRPE